MRRGVKGILKFIEWAKALICLCFLCCFLANAVKMEKKLYAFEDIIKICKKSYRINDFLLAIFEFKKQLWHIVLNEINTLDFVQFCVKICPDYCQHRCQWCLTEVIVEYLCYMPSTATTSMHCLQPQILPLIQFMVTVNPDLKSEIWNLSFYWFEESNNAEIKFVIRILFLLSRCHTNNNIEK